MKTFYDYWNSQDFIDWRNDEKNKHWLSILNYWKRKYDTGNLKEKANLSLDIRAMYRLFVL